MLHAASPRAARPFVWLQCYGMTEQAFQERLFGHLVPQSDGTESAREGILLSAAGGTLYLEDVDMLSMGCQNILAELIGKGRYSPPGARRSLGFDMRIIGSTSRELGSLVTDRLFRADLYYFLSVVEIVLPPLRRRSADIVDLALCFSEKLSQRMGTEVPAFLPMACFTPGSSRRPSWPSGTRSSSRSSSLSSR